jgi:endonuclease/exonuclease/phosphatase family metal-dependent hydrolase
VLFLEPDILGLQEVRPSQIEDLNTALTNYSYIGTGRDGGNEGEHTSIYYNTDKVKVENENTFWLSETPEKKSMGWDAAYPRICTYGLFTYRESKQKIWVFNTHLDHVGAEAQLEGIKLVLQKIESVNTKNYPVILMGDFNTEPGSAVYTETSKLLTDSKPLAELRFGPDGTFNGFKYDQPVTRRIDFIFISKNSDVAVVKYAVFSGTIDFKYPSDHFPVFVTLKRK